ncbi:hypothetical protein EIN_453200 [Entamoeba invadens IP1]|uniref:Uncharacterized protein n=1 Tax=Entamoeba invadens IP1 TaxID=370355 RepID=L7FLW7_ENTIV|nr:hypothetical protein EIN_453200 [Entamoeba invadens IP1]ELP89690.1 hypothetical protein EIN_453200 [Entamoeba invadens IP1]|eukprot:XP_004256461.1 hypothetical protein EIN_453200 [Entamoeba invadens IP1]
MLTLSVCYSKVNCVLQKGEMDYLISEELGENPIEIGSDIIPNDLEIVIQIVNALAQWEIQKESERGTIEMFKQFLSKEILKEPFAKLKVEMVRWFDKNKLRMGVEELKARKQQIEHIEVVLTTFESGDPTTDELFGLVCKVGTLPHELLK